MIVLIFALIDLFAAAMMFSTRFYPSMQFITLMAAFFLFLKSIFFIDDFASWVDLMAVFFLVMEAFGMNSIFSYFLIVWLIQKGLRSLF